ncbi:MAG: hypothetical protein IJ618_03800 [Prevotella sp.]|nr:hypothetical protein [Prevotella sp.]
MKQNSNKKIEAQKQVLEEIDLRMKTLQEEMEDLKERMKARREEMSALRVRKHEVKMQVMVSGENPVEWNQDTPLCDLVHSVYLDSFKKMLAEWQKQSEDSIDIKTANHFVFNPTYKHKVFLALKQAMVNNSNPPFFRNSGRNMCLYLETHSNLGSVDSIRKALQRCQIERGDKYVMETSSSVK